MVRKLHTDARGRHRDSQGFKSKSNIVCTRATNGATLDRLREALIINYPSSPDSVN